MGARAQALFVFPVEAVEPLSLPAQAGFQQAKAKQNFLGRYPWPDWIGPEAPARRNLLNRKRRPVWVVPHFHRVRKAIILHLKLAGPDLLLVPLQIG